MVNTSFLTSFKSKLSFVGMLTVGLLVANPAFSCQGDTHSWEEKSPSQYVFTGKDTCGGGKAFALEHNGYEIPVTLKPDGSYETVVAFGSGRNSVFIKNTNGEFSPLLDVKVDLQKNRVRQDQEAVSVSAFARPSNITNQSDTGKSGPDASSWSRLNDVEIDVAAMIKQEEKKSALTPPEKFFTVEMTWSEPVDLDLHIFEPSFKSTAVINEESSGHIWSKAPVSLRELAHGKLNEFESVAPGETRREVYHLKAVDGKIPAGAYQLKMDYRDRTVRNNQEPMTCGDGIYASPSATLHIKTADFDTKKTFNVPSVACGTSLVSGRVLATIGTIELQ